MKAFKSFALVFVGAVLCIGVSAWGADLGTAFTYQGELELGGVLETRTCDFKFSLWDDATATDPILHQVGPTLTFDGVGGNPPPITPENGRFGVELDFESGAITGQARWLEIEVCCPSPCPGAYSTLAPRQELTPSPHALALPGLWSEQHAISPNVIGGHSANTVAAGVYGATIGGGGDATYPNSVTGVYGTVGGGVENTASGVLGATVAGGGGNTASRPWATVAGGKSNTASGSCSFAAGHRAQANHMGSFVWSDSTTMDPAYFTSTGDNQFLINATGGVGIGTDSPSEALDVSGNIHASGTIASGSSITIDGTGGSEKISSSANLELHVGAGRALRIETYAISPNVIGGHSANTVAGAYGATIGGGGQAGWPNSVTADSGTVGGGWDNTASGIGATVVGGARNTASGLAATVAGGSRNTAGGNYSFAAGFLAQVRNNDPSSPNYSGDADGDEGTFMWADTTAADFTSTGPDQFLVRAAGGMYLGTNSTVSIPAGTFINTSTGAYLTTGGTWTNSSDRNAKHNIRPVKTRDILERVAGLEVARWNYRAEDSATDHIGPMAQDFHAALGVGDSDKSIATIDADGVALAAIQGLYEVVKEKDARIAALEARLAGLEKLMKSAGSDSEGGAR